MEKHQKTKLSIALKIFLVAASFTLPIGVLVWLVVENINLNRDVAVWEYKGCEYQVPLENLMQNIQDHQLTFHYAPTGVDKSQKLASLKTKIEKNFEDLLAVNAKHGVDLQFTAEGLAKRSRQTATIPNLKDQWSQIVSATSAQTTPADLDAKYDAAVATVQTMITHMGDTSNLILDPVLDSYYLMDVVLCAMPPAQTRLAAAIAKGRELIQKGSLTAQDRTDLAVFGALLQSSDQDRINGSLKTSFNENLNTASTNSTYGTSSSFQGNIPPIQKNYNDAAAEFIKLVNQLASSETPSVKIDDFVNAGMKAREAIFKLELASIKELQGLLQIRIDYFNNRRTVALALAALALLIAGLIAYAITRSIVLPLNKLARTLGPGATLLSGCVTQISDAFKSGSMDKDTTAIICDELDAHSTDMKKTVVELETVVFGKSTTGNK
jgi:hypothetical protein